MGLLGALFGASSNSSSSNTTQNNTTTYTDQSQMFGDNAVTGSNNAWVDASNRSTTFTDQSNRSTTFTDNSNRSTNFSDSSNRSTNFSDSSNSHNVTTTNTTITNSDFGSIGAAMSGMGKVSEQSINMSGASIQSMFDFMKFDVAQSQKNIDLAFGTARASQSLAEKTAAQVIGFADSTTAKAKDAFETATQPEQKKMMYAALAVIAVVGFMALRK